MSFLLQPWHILLAALCGLINERQQQIIEFQNAQIEALLKKLGKKRLLLEDDQRRLLAVKAHAIGNQNLLELTTIFTPGTILRWHANSSQRSSIAATSENTAGLASVRQSSTQSSVSTERIRRGAMTAFKAH